MSEPASDPQTRAPRLPWGAVLVLAVLGVVWAALAIYVAWDPRRRRRALNTAGRTWLRVEDAADRSTRRLQRARQRREAQVRRIAKELWDAVDDLPHVVCSIAIPQVPRRPYAHGGYMGAAPALLGHPRWRRILAFLMPDVYRDVREVVEKGARPSVLIPMFENNPVVAAFGVWRAAEARRAGTPLGGTPDDLEAMEWDLFLSSDLVDTWESAPEAERPAVLRRIVDSLVIAHASTTDTMQEQIGLCQWGDVRKTRKTRLGGVQLGAWLDLFGRALHLAAVDELAPAIGAMVREPRHESGDECVLHTFVREWAPSDVVAQYRLASGRPHLSVVIEIKSLQVRAALLGEIVRELNAHGVHVAAVGSFSSAEIRGVGAVEQRLDGVALPGPREILFLHFVGDVQYAADRKQLLPGTSVMFNGASLLEATRDGRAYRYRVDEGVVDELEKYRQRHELEIGIYVQENDCDAEAARLLSELLARRPETFALGFAWGGVLDEVQFEAGQGDHRGFGSQRMLGRVGWASSSWRRRRA